MVKLKQPFLYLSVFIFAMLTVACTTPSKEACKRYAEVCEALTTQEQVDAIVSLKLATDMDAFKAFLDQQEVPYSSDFEVTNQILVSIKSDDLTTLSLSELISDISVDSFYPR